MNNPKQNCSYGYDYENKCDCSEDDKCGCSFPNNMSHDFDKHCENGDCSEEDDDDDGNLCNCLTTRTLRCENLIIENIEFPDSASCQCNDNCHCNSVMVRDLAPDFTAPAVMPDNTIINDFNLDNYLFGTYGLLIFYPADFTFVCPSELLAFNRRLDEFTKRGVKVAAISVDSPHVHLAWKRTPVKEGGIGNLNYPLVSDVNKDISYKYGVLNEEGTALRGSFLIDKSGIVRHQIINDLPLGRDVDETLRIIDALQFYEKNGEVCPANLHKVDEAITPTPQGIADYLNKNLENLS